MPKVEAVSFFGVKERKWKPILSLLRKVHRFAVTFFDAKESNQRKAPLSRSKARWKIAALRRKRNSPAANVSKLKQPFS